MNLQIGNEKSREVETENRRSKPSFTIEQTFRTIVAGIQNQAGTTGSE
jgi:hypothetical protein